MKIRSFETEEIELNSPEVTVKITALIRDERTDKHIEAQSIIIPRMFIGDKKKVRFKIEIGELEG